MTYRATHTPSGPQVPLLRRPAEPGRWPAPPFSPPSKCAGLPAFLKPSSAHGDYWSESEGPVRITGFDPREHILTLEFESGVTLPDLHVETDESRSVGSLYANGKPVAVLHLEDAGFSLDHVAVTQSDN